VSLSSGTTSTDDSAGAGRPVRIAVDAMGGDNAPGAEVEGAIAAVREAAGSLEIVLVGQTEVLEAQLARQGVGDLPLTVAHADEIITMHESPADAVRRKRGSSIVIAAGLHKSGAVDGLVSAGNTGAVVASTLLGLGMLPNVRRPAIASFFPALGEPAVVLDVGASVDCRPSDLLEFAVMGSAYVQDVLERERPRVALMNVGEEPSKGNEVTQAAYRLISDSPLNFVGNVEGRDLMTGAADVVVCDGFVGNVMLKVIESVLYVLPRFTGGDEKSMGLDGIRKQFDYEEYGGAPLLGVNGVVIIAHGGSSGKAIKNAALMAQRFVQKNLGGTIVERLREVAISNGNERA